MDQQSPFGYSLRCSLRCSLPSMVLKRARSRPRERQAMPRDNDNVVHGPSRKKQRRQHAPSLPSSAASDASAASATLFDIPSHVLKDCILRFLSCRDWSCLRAINRAALKWCQPLPKRVVFSAISSMSSQPPAMLGTHSLPELLRLLRVIADGQIVHVPKGVEAGGSIVIRVDVRGLVPSTDTYGLCEDVLSIQLHHAADSQRQYTIGHYTGLLQPRVFVGIQNATPEDILRKLSVIIDRQLRRRLVTWK
jgi:hypothetical protein